MPVVAAAHHTSGQGTDRGEPILNEDDGRIGRALVAGALGLTDLVAVIDSSGTVVSVNPYGLDLLGLEAGQIIGRSVFELLPSDEHDRAITAVSRVQDAGLKIPVTPAYFHFRTGSGAYLRMEVNGSGYDTGDDQGVVFVCRPTTDADLHEHLMELLTSGAPSALAFELVPSFGEWRQPGLHHAVFYLDDEGSPRAAGSPVLVDLGGLDDPTAPWAAVAADGVELFVPVAELCDGYRARAEGAGLTHLRARAVWDPLHHTHALAVYGQDGASPYPPDGRGLEISVWVLDNMASVLGLILLWRSQAVELRRAATTDPLTGLANRTGFRAGLDRVATEQGDGLLAVLVIDLDRLKEVNDTHGHRAGDTVLLEVADRLRRTVRPGDVIARLGGDEFAIIASQLSDVSAATAIAARIVALVAEPVELDGRFVQVGASVGVATSAPADRVSVDDLLDAADRALYQAKSSGRGRWSLDPPSR